MAFDDDRILQDYIARLLSVQDTRDALLDESDLQAAARDLGLSERDLARAESIAEAHRQRGKNFAQHNAWDEAIAEYRQAMVLDPFDVPLLHELAVAHASRYEETHDPADREAAYTYAQRCTQLDPKHTPSFALISALSKTPQTGAALDSGSRVLVIMAAAALIVAGAVAALFMTPGEPTPQPKQETPEAPHTPISETETARERQVPVRLEIANAEGLQLDVQRSQFNDYDSSFAYKLHATLLNQQDELHRLQMTLDLLGAGGTVLHSKRFDARSDHQPPLRPADTTPLNELVFERQSPPAIESARLTVTHLEREPAAADYGTSPQVPLVWEITQPAHDLTFSERENSLRPNFNKHLHFLTFAVHNNGPRTVERLRIEVKWLTTSKEVITSKTAYAVPSSGPGLRAGATWLARVIGELPDADTARYDHYTVHVIEAE